MSRKYAEDTKVPVERSQQELRKLLARFNADQIMTYWDAERTVVAFRARNRMFKIMLPIPADNAQAERAAWRQLLLVIKAKITAIDSGITTFEHEFLAYTMLPDGSTMGEWAESAVAHAYENNQMPALMPGGTVA